jgi:CrcB protein
MDNTTFPAGTLTVNAAGSFIIGLVMTVSLERGLLADEVRIFLTTGFCGGFTTMSTFSYETMSLLQNGERALAFGNCGATIAACFGAVWLGNVTARLL